jgi:hypothetical protein
MNRTGFEKIIKYRNRFSKRKEHVFLKGFVLIMRVPKVLPTIIELISKLKIRRYLSIYVRMN